MRKPDSWTTTGRQRVYDHALIGIDLHAVRSSRGRRREVLVLDSADWVNVIPIVEDRGPACAVDARVLMVRQWRFAVAEPTLEIPGGIVDAGEEPLAAAARELLEETGYRAGTMTSLGSVRPNPAILSNRCHTYLARGLERVGTAEGDGEEEIELASVPLTAVPHLIVTGEISHSLVISAFHLLHLANLP